MKTIIIIRDIVIFINLFVFSLEQPGQNVNPFGGNGISWRAMLSNQVQGNIPDLSFNGNAQQANANFQQQQNILNPQGNGQQAQPNLAGFNYHNSQWIAQNLSNLFYY